MFVVAFSVCLLTACCCVRLVKPRFSAPSLSLSLLLLDSPFAGKQLQAGSTLSNYNIQKDMAAPAAPAALSRSRSRLAPTLIVVNAISGRCNRYNYGGAISTFGHLKRFIHDREGIPPHQQRLVVDGEVMGNGMSISQYLRLRVNVVMLQVAGELQLFVYLPSGRSVTVSAKATDTVGRLKDKLAELGGTPSRNQRLLFAGVALDDYSAPLGNYGIQHESTLHLQTLPGDRSSSHSSSSR